MAKKSANRMFVLLSHLSDAAKRGFPFAVLQWSLIMQDARLRYAKTFLSYLRRAADDKSNFLLVALRSPAQSLL